MKKKYVEGLSKNRYVARTFIMPGQQLREKNIRIKHNPIHFWLLGGCEVGCSERIERPSGRRLDRAWDDVQTDCRCSCWEDRVM